LLEKCGSISNVNLLDNLLKSTILGINLQSLLTVVWRKKLSHNVTVARALLPSIMELIQRVNKLNMLLPQVLESDKRYLNQLIGKRERAQIVESKHPYVHGKNQLKQTVTFAGAEGN
jgi:hypothetical protein